MQYVDTFRKDGMGKAVSWFLQQEIKMRMKLFIRALIFQNALPLVQYVLTEHEK